MAVVKLTSSGGGSGGAPDTSHLGGGVLITRLISSSITVPDGQTLVHRDPVLGPGVTITLAGTGELFVL